MMRLAPSPDPGKAVRNIAHLDQQSRVKVLVFVTFVCCFLLGLIRVEKRSRHGHRLSWPVIHNPDRVPISVVAFPIRRKQTLRPPVVFVVAEVKGLALDAHVLPSESQQGVLRCSRVIFPRLVS